MNPLDNPVNSALLGGEIVPGRSWPEGAALKRLWAERNGFGFDGAGLVYGGSRALIEFDLVVELATTADWNAWHRFKSVVLATPTRGRPQALDFWHPFTEDLSIGSVVVTSVSQLTPSGGTGLYLVKIGLRRYFRPVPRVVRAEESQGDKNQTKDPYDQEIDRLTDAVLAEAAR